LLSSRPFTVPTSCHRFPMLAFATIFFCCPPPILYLTPLAVPNILSTVISFVHDTHSGVTEVPVPPLSVRFLSTSFCDWTNSFCRFHPSPRSLCLTPSFCLPSLFLAPISGVGLLSPLFQQVPSYPDRMARSSPGYPFCRHKPSPFGAPSFFFLSTPPVVTFHVLGRC